jgi:hypothetical protein
VALVELIRRFISCPVEVYHLGWRKKGAWEKRCGGCLECTAPWSDKEAQAQIQLARELGINLDMNS